MSANYKRFTDPKTSSLSAHFRERQVAFATILRMPIRRVAGFGFLVFTFVFAGLLTSCDSSKSGVASGSSGVAASLGVAPDIDVRLSKFKALDMPLNRSGLSERELQLIQKLVDASNSIEQIYWRQSDPEGLALYAKLEKSQVSLDQRVLRFLKINGSHYDLIDELKPFVGSQPAPPGRALYPADLSRDEVEKYVAANPAQRNAVYDERSVLRRNGDKLEAVPYRVTYAEQLQKAAQDLREAARISEDAAFAKFLELRADALLRDDYYASDLAWLDLNNPKFDLILAPYESYLDNLLGVRTSFGAAVLIRNEAESQKLAVFQKYVPQLQEALPLSKQDLPSKRGHVTPMEVMDAPFRTGDLLHGYQAVADNLPNDPKVHEAKGSKKIFFKNFMDARVNEVILPIAKRLLREDEAARATGEGYLASTLAHEISHELGPNYSRTVNGKQDIREAIGKDFSGLEEAKADVVGMYCLKWLADHGTISKEQLDEDYISYVAGNFRTIRFGIAEPHARGEMMEFNYMLEQGAVTHDRATGRYAVVLEKMPAAIASLAKELLEQEATGDRARTAAWFAKYAALPDHLKKAFDQVVDIPVDIQPIYFFPVEIR
jgi:hypothetical protein